MTGYLVDELKKAVADSGAKPLVIVVSAQPRNSSTLLISRMSLILSCCDAAFVLQT